MVQGINRRKFLHRAAGVGALSLMPRLTPAADQATHGQRLLLLDPKALQSRRNLEIRMQRPVRHPDNPLVRPEKPWEFGYLYCNTAHYDPRTERWRLWASTCVIEKEEEHRLCLFESKDGLHWERPSLELVEFRGSKQNNLLDGPDGPVLVDSRDPDPMRRYKLVACIKGHDASIYFSPDGVRWSAARGNPIVSKIGDTHGFLGWDERIGKYVAYWRLGGLDRNYGYAVSSDFEKWEPFRRLRTVDVHDTLGTCVYQMLVFKIADLYACVAPVLHVDRGLKDLAQKDPVGQEQTVDMQLLISPDGIEWQRPFDRQPFLPLGDCESWDDTQIYPAAPVTVGDEVRIYYNGCNLRHNPEELKLCGKQVGGRWRGSCLGLATLKRDRWAAAVPGPGKGELHTRSFVFRGTQIGLNAEVGSGRIEAELTDPAGQALEGFRRDQSQLGAQAGLILPLSWKTGDLHALRGKDVCLRVFLTRAKLFAIEVA